MGEKVLSYKYLTHNEYSWFNSELKDKNTLDVLKWSYQTFGDELVYACSFGAEGVVLIDHISRVKNDAHIIFLDTDFHFNETYDLIEQIKQKYPSLIIELLKPDLTPDEQTQQYGAKLWEQEPDQCCRIRKIQPLEQKLTRYKAWITGLRRDQGPSRRDTEYINKDDRFKSIKICPLIHWSWDDVWHYIECHNLPYNNLHDQNYPSIGCEQCTLPVTHDEDPRAGRWAGQTKTECGLHS